MEFALGVTLSKSKMRDSIGISDGTRYVVTVNCRLPTTTMRENARTVGRCLLKRDCFSTSAVPWVKSSLFVSGSSTSPGESSYKESMSMLALDLPATRTAATYPIQDIIIGSCRFLLFSKNGLPSVAATRSVITATDGWERMSMACVRNSRGASAPYRILFNGGVMPVMIPSHVAVMGIWSALQRGPSHLHRNSPRVDDVEDLVCQMPPALAAILLAVHVIPCCEKVYAQLQKVLVHAML